MDEPQQSNAWSTRATGSFVTCPITRWRPGFSIAICLLMAIAFSPSALARGDSAAKTGKPNAGMWDASHAGFKPLEARLKKLANAHRSISLSSLGKTAGNRDVWMLTIAMGDRNIADNQPAILVLGSTDAPYLLGTELAVRMANSLATQMEEIAKKKQGKVTLDKRSQGKYATQPLHRYTFYIIPRPSPDATEHVFDKLRQRRDGNDRPSDDDRDGEVGEDGNEDLNGDGVITMMRVEDPTGEYMLHPDDPRVLIKADPKKDERGRYRLLTEGRDNDRDEKFNEDGSDGVAFNRNFPFKYPYFKPGAGPHQVSEPENRAVADFAFDHPNIALVFSFGEDDNLFHPWKPGGDKGRIKRGVQGDDVTYLNFLADQFRKVHGGKSPPPPVRGQGSFATWAYFHFGRWSLTTRGWWIPQVKPTPMKPEKNPDAKKAHAEQRLEGFGRSDIIGQRRAAWSWQFVHEERPIDEDDADQAASPEPYVKQTPKPQVIKPSPKPAPKPDPKKTPSNEKRGAADLNRLRWIEQQGIDGFKPWTKINHPDFPGKVVEVGGFDPLLGLNPPVGEVPKLAEKHTGYVAGLVQWLPQVTISDVGVEALGSNVYRLRATVSNTGFMPTMTQMGRINRTPYPLQLELLEASEQVKPEQPKPVQLMLQLLDGHPRTALPAIHGSGGAVQHTWLIRTTRNNLTFKVYGPSIHPHVRKVSLK